MASKGSRGNRVGHNAGHASTTEGRTGVSSPAATNASSKVFQFTDTLAASATKTYVLSADDDFVSVFLNLSVTAAGYSKTADILGAISEMDILAGDGQIIATQPKTDLYDLEQRFNPLHVRPAITYTSVATAISASYTIHGVNLPKARGPYSLMISTPAAAAFNASVTALSVVVTISLGVGQCNERTRYVYSGLPFTPSANGVNDFAPVAPIQTADLVEIFLTGMTSNTADINYVQLQSQGGVLGPRITAGDLVSHSNSEMVSALPSTEIFLLFALQTTLQLGRAAHAYFNWGATPASTIRTGLYWLD